MKLTKPKPYQNKTNIPKNINECISEMLKWGKDLNDFKNKSEGSAVATTHPTVGRWIRNNWGLWGELSELKTYFINMGVEHPDDMSGLIIRCLHRHLNNQPLNIEVETDRIKNLRI